VSKVSDIADGVVDTLVSPDETSIATGLPGMDQIIPGWRPGQFIIQCARPAMGKTSMLMQSAMSASADGYNVLFFSLEMSKEELVTRALCQVAGINVHDLLQHGASEQDEVSLRKAAKLVSLDKIMICDDGGMTMERIAAVARSRSRTGLDMVLIDYLGLVTPPRSNTRNDEVASISRMAKVLAKDIKVPVLAAHQLNREATKRPNQRPVLSDLRDSGALEQDADVVIGLHRDDYYHATDTAYSNSQTAEFIVLKHRNGPSGKASCRWNPNTMSFTEMF
jgi:replicative DNA helicase